MFVFISKPLNISSVILLTPPPKIKRTERSERENMALPEINIRRCINKGRAGSKGVTKFTWCFIEGSEAILVLADGIVKGVTGNASFEEVETLGALIGQSAANVGITSAMLEM